MPSFTLLPPAPGLCQECAGDHEADWPHMPSLFYKVHFKMAHKREPTWADAIAHCSTQMQNLWRDELKKRKAWNGPEATDG